MLLFTSCYSSKKLNEKTGLFEKSKTNKAFLIYGKDFNVTTKFYNNDTLIAKRITYNVFNCTNTEKKAEEIIYYDHNHKKTKQIKYYFQGENRRIILKSETIFENKNSKNSTLEMIEYTVENLFEIESSLLY